MGTVTSKIMNKLYGGSNQVHIVTPDVTIKQSAVEDNNCVIETVVPVLKLPSSVVQEESRLPVSESNI